MKFLLDTHTFMWIEEKNPALSPRVQKFVDDRQNDLFLSYVSIWEIQIKLSIGKLDSKSPLNERVILAQTTTQLQLLPIKLEHIYMLNELPMHHRDPFDRLLIAQSIYEGIPLISKDEKFGAYDLQLVW